MMTSQSSITSSLGMVKDKQKLRIAALVGIGVLFHFLGRIVKPSRGEEGDEDIGNGGRGGMGDGRRNGGDSEGCMVLRDYVVIMVFISSVVMVVMVTEDSKGGRGMVIVIIRGGMIVMGVWC